MTPCILVVDDETDLLAILEYNLHREGFLTRSASTGAEAIGKANLDPKPDLVLLDLMLPDCSGTEVCRKLKENPATRGIPVMMLTARGEEVDRIVGFEVGADDYVVKPFSVRELLLRVRALLRRTQAAESTPAAVVATPSDAAELVTFGVLRLDRGAHRVTVSDSDVVLTALEFRLLETFLARKGRVQSRETLLQDVWGVSAEITTRTVDTHVKRLREKLGVAANYIETLRGVGYRFVLRPDDASNVES